MPIAVSKVNTVDILAQSVCVAITITSADIRRVAHNLELGFTSYGELWSGFVLSITVSRVVIDDRQCRGHQQCVRRGCPVVRNGGLSIDDSKGRTPRLRST
jgi:hypothetical protein